VKKRTTLCRVVPKTLFGRGFIPPHLHNHKYPARGIFIGWWEHSACALCVGNEPGGGIFLFRCIFLRKRKAEPGSRALNRFQTQWRKPTAWLSWGNERRSHAALRRTSPGRSHSVFCERTIERNKILSELTPPSTSTITNTPQGVFVIVEVVVKESITR